ncbi:glycosyltransferase [Vibrio sp. 05-20-BW147]|uniref:glycosyltransferase n=1 Tax=Vibrio sp. 05-20-BW147 TaxID=2575834 RepID=UPI001593E5CB|nr:glycosyltransferase [Vibrio sp. 05-20-BW147]NVC65323.1 glycosyltransferase [Vibrio sp. 05-20-BW147]
MKLTVITSTLNCFEEIKKTAASIRNSGNIDIQWVVIDGNSSDGTVEYINDNLELVDVFISEPDTGIYDAWNKGIKYIKGDWVLFLGAGDEIIGSGVQVLLDYIKSDTTNRTMYYGNVNLIDSDGIKLLKYKEVSLGNWSSGRPDLPCHQGVFQHISLFNVTPVFDTKYKIAADSKFLLTNIYQSSIYYMDIDVANMEYLGVSTNPVHVLKVTKELANLREELMLKAPKFSLLKFHFKSYVKYFLSKVIGINLKPRAKN